MEHILKILHSTSYSQYQGSLPIFLSIANSAIALWRIRLDPPNPRWRVNFSKFLVLTIQDGVLQDYNWNIIFRLSNLNDMFSKSFRTYCNDVKIENIFILIFFNDCTGPKLLEKVEICHVI